MRNELIKFGKWLKHLDNGTEHYDPETKQFTESIGFSPWDCFTDDIMTVEEIVNAYLKQIYEIK